MCFYLYYICFFPLLIYGVVFWAPQSWRKVQCRYTWRQINIIYCIFIVIVDLMLLLRLWFGLCETIDWDLYLTPESVNLSQEERECTNTTHHHNEVKLVVFSGCMRPAEDPHIILTGTQCRGERTSWFVCECAQGSLQCRPGRVPAAEISGSRPRHDVITSQTKEPQLSVTLCLWRREPSTQCVCLCVSIIPVWWRGCCQLSVPTVCQSYSCPQKITPGEFFFLEL